MLTTTTATRRRARRARALVALPMAAALTLGVAACSRDDDAESRDQEAHAEASAGPDGEAAADASAPDGAPESGEPAPGEPAGFGDTAGEAVAAEGNDPAAAGSAADAPQLDNAALLLTAEDFPGMQFQPVDPAESAEAMRRVEAFAATMTFDPPECADATNVSSRLPENTAMANVVDPSGNVAYTVGVLGTGVDVREFADQNNRCKDVRMTGAGITGNTRTTQVAGPTIPGANVQAFDVVSTSRVDALNQEQSQSVANYQITTRGVTYRVAATQLTPEIAPDVRARLDEIATRQADKIKNS